MSHTFFFICTTARSGSNLVCDYLSNTRLIGTVAEYMNPDVVRNGWQGQSFPFRGNVSLTRYLDFLTTAQGKRGVPLAVKLLYEDLEYLGQTAMLHEVLKASKLLLLRRRSKVSQAISYYLAEKTGRWIHTDEGFADPEAVEYDFDRIDEILNMLTRQESAWATFCDWLGVRYYDLCFEDFIAAPRKTLEALCEYAAVPMIRNFPVETTLLEQKSSLGRAFKARYLDEKWAAASRLEEIEYRGIVFTR